MRPLDEHIGGTVALVVDGDASSRAVRTTMLRDCGVGTVLQASRPQDARRLRHHARRTRHLGEDVEQHDVIERALPERELLRVPQAHARVLRLRERNGRARADIG